MSHHLLCLPQASVMSTQRVTAAPQAASPLSTFTGSDSKCFSFWGDRQVHCCQKARSVSGLALSASCFLCLSACVPGWLVTVSQTHGDPCPRAPCHFRWKKLGHMYPRCAPRTTNCSTPTWPPACLLRASRLRPHRVGKGRRRTLQTPSDRTDDWSPLRTTLPPHPPPHPQQVAALGAAAEWGRC